MPISKIIERLQFMQSKRGDITFDYVQIEQQLFDLKDDWMIGHCTHKDDGKGVMMLFEDMPY